MNNLEDIKNRLAAATPGPWEARRCVAHPGKKVVGPRSADDIGKGPITLMMPLFWDHQSAANAEFIAHAPDDIARLVKTLEAVQSVPSSGFGDRWASGYNAALNQIRRAITEAFDS